MKDIFVTIISIVAAVALALLLIGNNDNSIMNKTKGLFQKQVEVLTEK